MIKCPKCEHEFEDEQFEYYKGCLSSAIERQKDNLKYLQRLYGLVNNIDDEVSEFTEEDILAVKNYQHSGLKYLKNLNDFIKDTKG